MQKRAHSENSPPTPRQRHDAIARDRGGAGGARHHARRRGRTDRDDCSSDPAPLRIEPAGPRAPGRPAGARPCAAAEGVPRAVEHGDKTAGASAETWCGTRGRSVPWHG